MIRVSYFTASKLPVGTRLQNDFGKDIGYVNAMVPLDNRYSRTELYLTEDLPLNKVFTNFGGKRALREIKNE